jgi:hypothetical protein
MAAAGILGEYKGSQAREVMMTMGEYKGICDRMAKDEAAGYADMADDDEAEKSAETAFTNEGQKEYLSVDSDDDEEYEDDED